MDRFLISFEFIHGEDTSRLYYARLTDTVTNEFVEPQVPGATTINGAIAELEQAINAYYNKKDGFKERDAETKE